MTQNERLQELLHTLLAEPQAPQADIPRDIESQKQLLRALMNIRPPRPVNERFLRIQDDYLQEELRHMPITDAMTLPVIDPHYDMSLWQGDITTLKADAIVNAANSALRGCFIPLHSCIDNIIHSRSGIQLRLACDDLMNRQGHEERTGSAKITPAFNLPCRFVLHTVGPIVQGKVTDQDQEALASCYRSCLKLALENHCESIAFCCISTGEFHFPNELAAKIAVHTVEAFLDAQDQHIRVIFNVFKDIDLHIYSHLLEDA